MAALLNPVRCEQHLVAEQANTEEALAHRCAPWPPLPLQAYLVSVTLPCGQQRSWQRWGGNTLDHTLEAQDAHGLGCTIRVKRLGGAA